MELRLCWRWVMSGVLDVTLQRSEQRWWGWCAHKVRGLAEAERGQRGESEEEGNFVKSLPTFTQQCIIKHLLFDIYYMNDNPYFSPNLRPSLPLLRTLAALRLRARKDKVGVISRSTILLSHGLSARLRAAGRDNITVASKICLVWIFSVEPELC